jgi:hypothetical protein
MPGSARFLFVETSNRNTPIPTALDIDLADIDRIFRSAARIYIETRRTRVPYFVREHFGLRGAVRIHRVALGWDLLRAPTNLALALPHLLKFLFAGILRRAGAPGVADLLVRFPTQIATDVEREIEWLIWTELLELPFAQGRRVSDRDALAETLMARPEIARAMTALHEIVAAHRESPEFQASLAENLTRYSGARNSAAEIATALASAGAGGLMVQQLTPTAFSLGPPLAALLANQAAILAFPLGTGIGGAWYAVFPVEPSWQLVAAMTGGLLVVSSVVAAFAGVVADPVQRLFGIHRRRLDRFIAAIGDDLTGDGNTRFTVRSHYVARLFDFFEAVRMAVRAVT